MLTKSLQPYYFILIPFRVKFFLRKCLSNRTTVFYGAEVIPIDREWQPFNATAIQHADQMETSDSLKSFSKFLSLI